MKTNAPETTKAARTARTTLRRIVAGCAAVAVAAAMPAPAFAKDAPELVKCEQSLGTIALVDGDGAGWTQFKLGSPRNLVNSLAVQSGCFTPHTPDASGAPARYLVTAIAGTQEEVDQGMELAKSAVTEGMLRTGALGAVASKVPFAGALLGAFGGFGGKKKTVSAGLRVVSPASGQTLAAGSGSVKKSTLNFRGSQYAWAAEAASTSGYDGSKNGAMMTEAFILAFNEVVAQRAALETAPAAGATAVAPISTTASAAAVVAVDTSLRASADAGAAVVRDVRAGTELTPTGQRDGLFIEVADNYGTTGWVSVEDME
ncbi:MAG: SH3 domain-containing protein [Parerythrobacter sp.]